MKPLRLIGRNAGLELAINALMVSIPVIANYVFMSMVFFSVLAILGMKFFKGMHEYCWTDALSLTNR